MADMIDHRPLGIIIPVFNRKEHIHVLLQALLGQTYGDFRVVVVDHGTEKIEFSWIADERIEIINENPELWWTGAVNSGINYVRANRQKEKHILILNDDITIGPDYLQNVVSVIAEYDESVIGSISVDHGTGSIVNAGGLLVPCKARFWSPWKGKRPDQIQELFLDSDTLTGRGMVIPLSVIDKIGVFNEKRLPHYGADNEFAWRAKRHSISVICAKQCVVSTLPKDNTLYMFKKTSSFLFDIRKPGNVLVIYDFAFLCFGKVYATYYVTVNFLRIMMSYVKKAVLHG